MLAAHLKEYANRPDVLVLALPRGGVPVGFEIAQALKAPLDVLVVRKLGLPQQPEVALGAIASGGLRVLNNDLLAAISIPSAEIEAVTKRERQELERRERAYRGNELFPSVYGRTVILVDDGMATGTTMHAAVATLKTLQPAQIVIAVPVAAAEACAEFQQLDGQVRCVCLLAPTNFVAVGLWYEHFLQTTDEEVCALLERARRQATGSAN